MHCHGRDIPLVYSTIAFRKSPALYNLFPDVLKASASSGVGGATGLGGDLCGGGTGPSPLTSVPFVFGESKAPGMFCGGGEVAVGPSESRSMGVGSDIFDKIDNLCSGGQFKGCSFRSTSRDVRFTGFREMRLLREDEDGDAAGSGLEFSSRALDDFEGDFFCGDREPDLE
jgi:hypothetical protein